LFEADVSVRPKPFAKRRSPYYLPSVFNQHLQDLKGFFLQPEAHAVFAKLARLEIDLEIAETNYRGRILAITHWLSRDSPGLDLRLPAAPFCLHLIFRLKPFALKSLDADKDLSFC
jgi:hypothetical protein